MTRYTHEPQLSACLGFMTIEDGWRCNLDDHWQEIRLEDDLKLCLIRVNAVLAFLTHPLSTLHKPLPYPTFAYLLSPIFAITAEEFTRDHLWNGK